MIDAVFQFASPSRSVPAVALVVLVAVVLELTVREPPSSIHPVAWFGRGVGSLDRDWSRPRLVGIFIIIGAPLAPAGVAYGVLWSLGAYSVWAVILAGGTILFVTTSLGMLVDEATAVIEATTGDLSAARQALPALAGRDPGELTAEQIRSAAVESAGENLADGLVAPLLAFTVVAPLSVPLGAATACWVKAVNTLDSMLGYPSKPLGTASAKLDDLVMWVPARLSALLLATAGWNIHSLRVARPLADRPSSPNSGWPMSVLAGTVGVRLEKPGAYELPAGPSLPDSEESLRAVRVVNRAGLLAYGLAVLVGVVVWF